MPLFSLDSTGYDIVGLLCMFVRVILNKIVACQHEFRVLYPFHYHVLRIFVVQRDANLQSIEVNKHLSKAFDLL